LGQPQHYVSPVNTAVIAATLISAKSAKSALDIIQIIFDFNGGPGTLGDVNVDGAVNTLDILVVVAVWGSC
jgi:hypothetical protein